ncbi:hypothetical protein CIT292_08897 [Citrobacter youngae ATCC 29220]|uniref:Uncharacterized protein n=1 Tax=Citrobacter youngae ATCC 29220 TaxID=500640 RepID=D4BEG4_9ENTR|nr:hypothetical protein CIT292_08897 [Citrobacter youngae ATCC 29220]
MRQPVPVIIMVAPSRMRRSSFSVSLPRSLYCQHSAASLFTMHGFY